MSESGKGQKQFLVNPPGTEKTYEIFKFSQAVRVGDTVWVAGKVGVDDQRNMGEGIEAQTRIAFKNLEATLNAAGASLADIVELVTYHISMKDIAGFQAAKSEFIPENYPTWTAVGVTELAMPGLLVEIKAVAVIGSGS
jgi:enamine deaminase RidA (YjgF/YER057c/UK114 family)